MLQKQYRLPASIRLKNASSFSTPFFFLKVSKNNLPYNRYGFVVRKTVDKRATVRNRIRRVFRSCIEGLLAQIASGHDMLFVLNRATLEIKREELYNELQLFLKEKQLLQ